MDKDNEAFAAECERSAGRMDIDDQPKWAQEDSTEQTTEPFTSQTGQTVNTSELDGPGSDGNHGGQEMQERAGSSLLSTSIGNAAVSRALDDDDEWKTAESDEEMADHVENTRVP